MGAIALPIARTVVTPAEEGGLSGRQEPGKCAKVRSIVASVTEPMTERRRHPRRRWTGPVTEWGYRLADRHEPSSSPPEAGLPAGKPMTGPSSGVELRSSWPADGAL